MGSIWLGTGPYSVRLNRTGSRKLCRRRPDLQDTLKTLKIQKIPPKEPEVRTARRKVGRFDSNWLPLRAPIIAVNN